MRGRRETRVLVQRRERRMEGAGRKDMIWDRISEGRLSTLERCKIVSSRGGAGTRRLSGFGHSESPG